MALAVGVNGWMQRSRDEGSGSCSNQGTEEHVCWVGRMSLEVALGGGRNGV